MRLAAAFRIRVCVSSLRSAWVRRRAGPTERRAEGAVEEILRARTGISDLNADFFVNDFDRVSSKRNLAGHARRFSGGDVESPEMKRAFHDLPRQNPLLRQRRFAMGADVGGRVNRTVHAIQRDMRTVGKRGLFDLTFRDLLGPT